MVKVVKFQAEEKGNQLTDVEYTFKRILLILFMDEHHSLKHDNKGSLSQNY